MLKDSLRKVFSKNVHKISNRSLFEETESNFFFIHIPKTAGTSFRRAFESEFHTFKDYGGNAKSTSNEMKQYIYQEHDIYRLKKIINRYRQAWITGHVNLVKYYNFVPSTNIITYVREPFEQVVSHYNHYIKFHDFKGTFEDFLSKPYSNNIQSKCLAALPLNLIGCVGITEFYDDSLTLINEQFSINLPNLQLNVNKTKEFHIDDLDDINKKLLLDNNQNDIAMYEEALFLHHQRFELVNKGRLWTYGCVAINAKHVLHGCAYQYQNDTPVKLVININNSQFKTVLCNQFYSAHVRANFPRERYIGFNVNLPKNLSVRDKIDVYVEKTGQKLNFKPLMIESNL